MGILDMLKLDGKTAVVVGGAGALGKGIAKSLSQAGARVIVMSRNLEKCEKTAKEIELETGISAEAETIDLQNSDDVIHKLNSVIEKKGHIDILVNCAGVNIRKKAEDYSIEDWDTVQNVQLKGVFFACQTVAKHMIKNQIRGKIINISSINSLVVARPQIVSYVAAKGAIMQMTKALAAEWARYGIAVNAIAPGFFETEMTAPLFKDPTISKEIISHIPMGHLGNTTTDLGGMAVLLASEASGYITGQLICIDGGYTIV